MNNTRKTLVSIALMVLIGAPTAIAQTGTGSGMTKSGGVPQAPVGHRQPRVSDVPNEKNLANPNDSISKEDAILDKKIKSICRGC
jgi:hypothetical protein